MGARLALSDVNAHGLEEALASLPRRTEAKTSIVDTSKTKQVVAHAEKRQPQYEYRGP